MRIRRIPILCILIVATLWAIPSSAQAAPGFALSDPAAFPGVGGYNPNFNFDEYRKDVRSRRAAFIRTAKSVGATHIRIWALWDDYIQCNPYRMFNFTLLLSAVQQTREAGLIPMISFGAVAADWGVPACPGAGPAGLGYNPYPGAYSAFVSSITRYLVRAPYNVRLFGTYNEPDLPTFLCVIPTIKKTKWGFRKVEIQMVQRRNKSNEPVGNKIPRGWYKTPAGVRTIPCDGSRAERRHRQLHAAAARAIAAEMHAIGLARKDVTIMLGDYTPNGLKFLTRQLRYTQKLDADVIAVHGYWHTRNEETGLDAIHPKFPTKCGKSAPDFYFGMECLGRVRELQRILRKEATKKHRRIPPILNAPIYVTEAGLTPSPAEKAKERQMRGLPKENDQTGQLWQPIYAAMSMEMMVDQGASLVTWYHVMNDYGAWDTHLVDPAGNPSKPGESVRLWAKSKGLKVSPTWLPAKTPVVSCATSGGVALFSVLDRCPFPDPPAAAGL